MGKQKIKNFRAVRLRLLMILGYKLICARLRHIINSHPSTVTGKGRDRATADAEQGWRPSSFLLLLGTGLSALTNHWS